MKLETVSIPLDGLNLPKWFDRKDLHVPRKWALEQNLLLDNPNLENLSLKSLKSYGIILFGQIKNHLVQNFHFLILKYQVMNHLLPNSLAKQQITAEKLG